MCVRACVRACVRVCMFCVIMLEHLSIILFFFFFFFLITFSIWLYIMCVCLFRALSRRVGAFTNFHYYYYYYYVRACVRARAHAHIFHIVMLEPLLMSINVLAFRQIADLSFHLHVRYVCHIILVQRFEPQGRRFTNFHYDIQYSCLYNIQRGVLYTYKIMEICEARESAVLFTAYKIYITYFVGGKKDCALLVCNIFDQMQSTRREWAGWEGGPSVSSSVSGHATPVVSISGDQQRTREGRRRETDSLGQGTDRTGGWGTDQEGGRGWGTDRTGGWGTDQEGGRGWGTDRTGGWGTDRTGGWGTDRTDRTGGWGTDRTDRTGGWGIALRQPANRAAHTDRY